jgi:hypothetical protein
MDAAAFAICPDAPDPAEARRCALLDRQLKRLARLVEAGMDMVQALAAQAAGSGPPVAGAGLGPIALQARRR